MKNCYFDIPTRTQVDITGTGEMVPNTRTITRIIVGDETQRGMGFGSAMLRQVCTDADTEGVTLTLELNPYGPLDYDDLVAWYRRYGFNFMHRYAGLMVRRPHALITPLRTD